jgi:hypothetical protein
VHWSKVGLSEELGTRAASERNSCKSLEPPVGHWAFDKMVTVDLVIFEGTMTAQRLDVGAMPRSRCVEQRIVWMESLCRPDNCLTVSSLLDNEQDTPFEHYWRCRR